MSNYQPLAIIGMGCRFPGGVTDADSYWQLLMRGASGISEIPANRWDWSKYYHPNNEVPGKMVTKWGGFVDNHDQFDAQFFGISPREAQQMDVQQRWLLETSWQALEDAGLPPHALRGSRTGVFIGISSHDGVDIQRGDMSMIDIHSGTGSALSIAANRISYLFDFRGPSMAIDTACSSALVATHLACQSIWSGQSALALAGGVNAILNPNVSMSFSKASMLSPDGQCFAFDHRANGYVRGEGAGVVVIKPLRQAEMDGDLVYAIIRSVAVNQDGRTSSLTVPGRDAQEAMLREVYQNANIHPSRVAYIETHGTGTPVGDPIEAQALGHVLGEGRSPHQPCLIGSAKTNIGHLEAASGMAGLIKAALILHHRIIPPHLNFERVNPNIPLSELGLQVVTKAQELPQSENQPPVVGVNSFGFGGTNAHIVLEQAKQIDRSKSELIPANRPYLLPLSASNETALQAQADAYLTFLANSTNSLAETAASAGLRREHFDHRLAIIGQNPDELRSRLRDYLNNPASQSGLVVGKPAVQPSQPVFVFTGQGAQWWGMGRQLLEREPLFRQTVQTIDDLFQPLSDWSLLTEMTRPEADSQIDRTDIAQPAIFALQVALAELWAAWGVQPAKVIGHSVGEVAAAYIAGIYTLTDAVKIIYHRSRLQNKTAGQGNMVAVGLSLTEALRAIARYEDIVQVGAINSSGMVTLTGATAQVREIASKLEAAGVFVRRLPIEYAFHSFQMDPIREELLASLNNIQPQPSHIPFISTVTENAMRSESMDAAYWWDNVRQPVRFAQSLAGLIESGDTTFLELGPHPALQHSIHDCLAEQNRKGHVFHSLRRDTDETLELLGNLAELHIYGLPLNWTAVNQSDGHFTRLPCYPWQRQTYWLTSDLHRRQSLEPLVHPLLGMRLPAPKPTWEHQFDPRVLDYLNDHQIWDSIIFPAAGYGEIGLAVARILFPEESYVVETLQIKKALFVSIDHLPTVQTVFDETGKTFSIYSATGEKKEWQLHAQGVIRKIAPVDTPPANLVEMKRRLAFLAVKESYYQAYHEMGYQFGPDFQQIQNIWSAHGKALAEIVVSVPVSQQAAEYHFHPALLDACFQSVSAAARLIGTDQVSGEVSYLPAAFGRIQLLTEPLPNRFWVHASIIDQNRQSITADFQVYDEQGVLLAEILAGRFDKVKSNSAASQTQTPEYYQFQWEPKRLKNIPVQIPAQLADVTDMVDAAKEACPDIYKTHRLDAFFHEFLPQLEKVTGEIVENALITLGWDLPQGSVFSLDALTKNLCIIERHRPMLRAQLVGLEKTGFIQAAEEDEWLVLREPVQTEALAALEKLARDYPQAASDVALLQAVAPHLAEILRGRIDPMSLLFPGGSSNLLSTFYRIGVDQAAAYQLTHVAVTKAIEKLPSHRPLRILELGAGTGALTAAILPALPPDRTEYVFTDVSLKFLHEAKRQFASYNFVEYRSFDMNETPESQGVEAHSYDLVLAANALHTALDVKQSLDHVARCLAPDGLLLFLEGTKSYIYYNTVFGMFPDWWRRDPGASEFEIAWRSSSKWKQLLTEGGYRQVDLLTTTPDHAEHGTTILLAMAPKFEESPKEKITAQGTYLLFADKQGVASSLAESLTQIGARAITLIAAEKFEALAPDRYAINPTDESELSRLLDEIRADDAPLAAIVHAWGLDQPFVGELSAEQLATSQEIGTLHALRLTHLLSAEKFTHPPIVTFLSRDAQSVVDSDAYNGLASAPLIGFLRVANNEYSAFPWRLIDLDPAQPDDEIERLLYEIVKPDSELEIAYRQGWRYVNRLREIKADDLPPLQRNAIQADGSERPYRLEIGKPGVLSNLSLNETTRRSPEPNEIEVRVRAAGINFRDVMKVLGIYPGNPIDLTWLGDDFAGTVIAVGEQVDGLKPGDTVAGSAPYAFRSHLTVDHRAVFKAPPHLSFEEAAALPTVFLTAYYAIVYLARLQLGERILIHAATGGVGQAALQIAQDLKLEIFATAGTPEKRDFLREQGVTHVFDSRSLNFADDVMRATAGRGVDAVLNSLAGDFIPKNFSVLAPFGRYLEIGKVDVYNDSKIGLEALRNNISVFIIDLAQLMEHRPADFVSIFETLRQKFEQKIYRPIPCKISLISEATKAFRYMAAGKHIGKNVLSFQVEEIMVGRETEQGRLFRPEASYLITGGAGGFGLEVAKWMARQGARHLILMTRSGAPDEVAQADINQLRADGVTVLDARGDVTLLANVERVVRDAQNSSAPLAGVVHSAMVLNDELLSNLDDAGFNKAFHPKILGAWNLHQATLDIPLEHFICFSSMSSIIGNLKQANYSSGNAFLDGLTYYRRARGLPSLTINWGALSEAGFLDRNSGVSDYLQTIGLKALSMDMAKQALGHLLSLDARQAIVAFADWNKMSVYLSSIKTELFKYLLQQSSAEQTDAAVIAKIITAPPADRQALVENFLIQVVADILGAGAAQIDPAASLTNLGLDSLMAIELINSINSQLDLNLAVSDVLNSVNLQSIAAVVLEKILAMPEENLEEQPVTQAGILDGVEAYVDLFAESRLPESIQPDKIALPPVYPAQTILLTGATGFLGAFLLFDLLKQTQADIYCLVRADTVEAGLQRLQDNLAYYGLWDEQLRSRLKPLTGDLSQPRLGLSTAQFQRLAEEIDVIYHNGAVLNLLQPYAALKATNVLSVQEILQLACHTKIKPVHYVSTIAVFFATGKSRQTVVRESDFPDSENLYGGYMQSKWVAEQLIRQAQERGIPCSIYRPGLISGHSQSGVTNHQDLTSRLVKGSFQLALYPDRNREFNIVPVDYVSRAIVYLSQQPDMLGQTFHLTNAQPAQLKDVVNWAGSVGSALREIPYKTWRAALINQFQQGIQNDLLPILPLFSSDRPEQVEQRVDCNNTLAGLAGSGIVCPPIDANLINIYVNYMLDSGFLEIFPASTGASRRT